MVLRRVIGMLVLPALLLAGCGGSSGTQSTAANAGSTRSIAHAYTGRLTQAGIAPFRVAAVVNPNGAAAVAYTGINCGGVWALQSGSNSSQTYVFKETIVGAQPSHCKSSGTVTLTRASGGTLQYRFTGGGVQSTGVLVPASTSAVQAVFREAGLATLK